MHNHFHRVTKCWEIFLIFSKGVLSQSKHCSTRYCYVITNFFKVHCDPCSMSTFKVFSPWLTLIPWGEEDFAGASGEGWHMDLDVILMSHTPSLLACNSTISTSLIRSMSAVEVDDPFLGWCLKFPTLRRLQLLPLSWIAAVLVGVAKSRLGGLLLEFPLRTCKWPLS